jgi:signal transduction histidine kinase/DNA-binding NarL/FixJ family response regulator
MSFAVFKALKAAPSSDLIRSARSSLLFLSAVAVLGTLMAVAVGIVALTRTYHALDDAESVARTLQLHMQVDMVHDELRGDVATAATAGPQPDFERHAAQLEAYLRQLEGRPLPQALADEVRKVGSSARSYLAAVRQVMHKSGPITTADVLAITDQWRSLEIPLDRLTNELHGEVGDAQDRGSISYHNGLALLVLALVLITVGLVYAGRSITRTVLATGRQMTAASEAARRAGQSRAEFLAAMSHEIRTPMTGVLGMVDLLAAEQLSPLQRRYVEGMRASGRHLVNVINDILDFTRIESGRLELEQIDFSLPDVLERVRSLVHPLAVERGLALQMKLNPHSPPVLCGDPTRLQQVLLNLTTNAVKFTDEGTVTVTVAHVPQDDAGLRYRFEVRDTGVGIPADRQGELFNAFRQADETISRRFGGSGLGLAISKRLVEAMGGSIGMESAPGRGSLFWFELPVAIGDMGRLGTRGDPDRKPSQPRRILVAEDVEINRQILGTTLRRAGHTLTFAHDGEQAVKLAQEQTFDLVLMDVQMPIMDGIEATRRIRQLPGSNSEIPILALTANVMAQERERYLSAGMDECLTKPIDWDQLFGAIERHTPGGDQPMFRPVPLPVSASEEQSLLNPAVIDSLKEMAGPDVLREWMQTGLSGYERGHAAMSDAGDDPETIALEAHKIKGSGNTLGLPRIGALGARIEAEAKRGVVPEAMLAELQQAITATKARLTALDLL